MTLVGLTGQTGAGKSTAAEFLRDRGYPVIDCDRVSREVAAPDSACLAALVKEFSPAIKSPDGGLNRRELGRIVFSDRERLEKLNQLIFPFITREIKKQTAQLEQLGHRLVLLDAPTLFESGADRDCQRIISVTANVPLRLSRIRERDGISREEALRRMNSQLDEAFYREHSDFILENNGDREAFALRLSELDSYLQKLPGGLCNF